ncbi:GDSL-type esterase/lipase family protein [Paenibacillus sp. LHD-117]|uniref:GDSL-type esterase/lipase family protein n=1 Tax=Paenibacillus sp. LHD-117 TaxID=3071412 RepID=UPI0027DF2BD9|nr:GDSL-type esterase/lipase family protein [Paenibacillus sp. LHD-117]MDQ6422141.1 GDSL-type esterase/lipase family protein [Paenibacillus sp. LHD-117]
MLQVMTWKRLLLIWMGTFLFGGTLFAAVPAITATAETSPEPLFRADNLIVGPSAFPDFSDRVNDLKTLEEGTIIVKFKHTGSSIMSLFSLSNNTMPNGHFHLYVTPTSMGSENRFQQPGQTSSNTHVKADGLSLTAGQFHTVAMVADKDQGYKIFVDGSLVKHDITTPVKFLSNIYAPNSVRLGMTDRVQGSNEYPFTGEIAFAEVYAETLSDAKLLELTRNPDIPPVSADLQAVKAHIGLTANPAPFVFTGDDFTSSETEGSGYRNYIQHFEERIRWENAAVPAQRQNFVLRTGVNGMKASELLDDFDNRVASFSPKTVFLMLGPGDAAAGTTLQQFKNEVVELAQRVRSIGATPVLQTGTAPLAASDRAIVAPYADAIEEVAEQEELLLIDHYDTWSAYADLAAVTSADGESPNELGQLRLAKELMTFFGVGGSGNTWGINGFSDVKEEVLERLDRDIVYSITGEAVSVSLADTLGGLNLEDIEKIIVTRKNGSESYSRETVNLAERVKLGAIEAGTGFTLTVEVKLAGQNKVLAANPAYIEMDPPPPAVITDEISALVTGGEPVTWLFAGDSITHGALHTKGYKSFAELFGERIRGELSAVYPTRASDMVLNTGISSMTTRDLMSSFNRWVTAMNPDVVFIAFGMNDSSNRMVPLEEFKTNLRSAVTQVRSMGAVPVLQTINTIRDDAASRIAHLPVYVEAIRKIAEENDVLLVDHYRYWTEAAADETHLKSTWLNDSIHPGYIGMTHMASTIFKALGLNGPESYIDQLRYVAAQSTATVNSATPAIAGESGTITVDLAEVAAAAGGAGAVERITVTAVGNGGSKAVAETRRTEGTLTMGGLTPSESYIVKAVVKRKGQNSLIELKDTAVTLPSVFSSTLTGPDLVTSGETFSLELGLTDIGNPVMAHDITLHYDQTKLQFVDASPLAEGVSVLMAVSETPGIVRIIAASAGSEHAVQQDGPILRLDWIAKETETAANGTIGVSSYTVADEAGQETEAALAEHTVQVEPAAIGTPDVNGDGKVSIGDLAIIAAHYGKTVSSPDWNDVKRLDLDGSGTIDIADLAAAAQVLLQR